MSAQLCDSASAKTVVESQKENEKMKFIGRNLNLIGILMLATFGGAAAGLYWDVPGRIQKAGHAKEIKVTAGQYSCPMHADMVSAGPGNCPKCGMALTRASESQSSHAGCGATEQTAQQGCCAKPQPAEANLPPGHPPIHAQNPHAGCAPVMRATPSPENSSK